MDKIKFFVERTSIWDDRKPCDEAIAINIHHTDRRSYKTLADWQEKWPKDFDRATIDRGERDGGTYMVMLNTSVVYYVEADLLEFVRKYGECIIKFDYYYEHEDWPTVEIYDSYRE